jgi:hypothetical protein
MRDKSSGGPSFGFWFFAISALLAAVAFCLFMAAFSNSLTRGNNLGNTLASIALLLIVVAGIFNLLALIVGGLDFRYQGRVGFWYVLNVIGTGCFAYGAWVAANL